MLLIKHNRATFTVQPEHERETLDLLALIDKSKGKRGAKLNRPKGIDKHNSAKRDYPRFNPQMMLTSDYVTAYAALNHARLRLIPCAFEPGENRTPPSLDPSIPEVVEEPC